MMRLSNSCPVGMTVADSFDWSQWAITVTRAVHALGPAALSLRWSKEAKKVWAFSFVSPSRLTNSLASHVAECSIGSYIELVRGKRNRMMVKEAMEMGSGICFKKGQN